MEIDIRVPTLDVFKPLYKIDHGIAILMSGRGTGKTFASARLIIREILEKNHRCVVLRDEKTKVKETILKDIKDVFDAINEKTNGLLNTYYSFNEHELVDNRTKDSKIFTLGFRASTKDDKTKLKGLSNVKIVVIDEAEDVRDESKVNTLLDTVIRNKALVLFILNTPDKDHWLIKRYFDLFPSEHEGYFVPKPKNIPNVHYFLPTYKDNTKLNAEAIAQYEEYGNPNSPRYNREHYLSAILGLVSEGRIGRIYERWKRISVGEYESFEYPTKYGLDFGFTNDPTALIEIKEHNNILYIRQKIYQTMLTNDKIAEKIKGFNITKQITADSSEPKSIEEIKRMGINITGADKIGGSVNAGIDKIRAMREVYVCEDSDDVWTEYLNYVWELDKNKQPTNDPVDDFNHSLDALRYALEARDVYIGDLI